MRTAADELGSPYNKNSSTGYGFLLQVDRLQLTAIYCNRRGV